MENPNHWTWMAHIMVGISVLIDFTRSCIWARSRINMEISQQCLRFEEKSLGIPHDHVNRLWLHNHDTLTGVPIWSRSCSWWHACLMKSRRNRCEMKTSRSLKTKRARAWSRCYAMSFMHSCCRQAVTGTADSMRGSCHKSTTTGHLTHVSGKRKQYIYL